MTPLEKLIARYWPELAAIARGALPRIALYPKWVRLFFADGAALPDPDRRLEGSGAGVRSVRLESGRTLDEPAVLRF